MIRALLYLDFQCALFKIQNKDYRFVSAYIRAKQ